MLKAQKSSKNVIKIVHVTSVVQPLFYEATRIIFVCKECITLYLYYNNRGCLLFYTIWLAACCVCVLLVCLVFLDCAHLDSRLSETCRSEPGWEDELRRGETSATADQH